MVILFRTLAKFVHEMECIVDPDKLSNAFVSLCETKDKWVLRLSFCDDEKGVNHE